MSKVRINDLARELEVKSREILDTLTAVGVTENKTHSSSLESDEAERVRAYLQRGSRGAASRRSFRREWAKAENRLVAGLQAWRCGARAVAAQRRSCGRCCNAASPRRSCCPAGSACQSQRSLRCRSRAATTPCGTQSMRLLRQLRARLFRSRGRSRALWLRLRLRFRRLRPSRRLGR